MEEKEEKFNEVMTENSKLESIKPHLPFIKGSLCLCKIRCPSFPGNFGQRDMYQMKNSSGSGFFIKIKNPDNNQEFKYFIITCACCSKGNYRKRCNQYICRLLL